MSQTWTDRVLAGLAELYAGQGDRHSLRTAVTTTAQGVREQLEHFRTSWAEDPEITEQEASQVERSLVDLAATLDSLALALGDPSPQVHDWKLWSSRIRSALFTVRQIRDKAKSGPTSQPLVNRLLLHLKSWQQGEPTPPATLLLLEQLPELEQQWDRVLGQLDEESQAELADALLPALQVFDGWREHLHDSPPPESADWHGQVVEALERFDQILGLKVQADLSAGPTPFPVLNLLVTAVEQCLQGSTDLSQVQALAGHAAQLLSLQINAESLKQSRLLETLAEVEAQAGAGHSAALSDSLETMLDRAEQLGVLVSMFATPDNLVDLTSLDGLGKGPERQTLALPPMLSSLHRLAADYLENPLGVANLRAGIKQLEEIVQRFSSRLALRSESGMQLALEDLSTVVELLQEFEGAPTSDLLDELEEVLEDCAESLAAVQGQGRNRASTS